MVSSMDVAWLLVEGALAGYPSSDPQPIVHRVIDPLTRSNIRAS